MCSALMFSGFSFLIKTNYWLPLTRYHCLLQASPLHFTDQKIGL